MNKKVIGIIGFIFVIIVIVLAYLFFVKHNSTDMPQNEPTEVSKTSLTIKGYNIDIRSKKIGSSSDEYYYRIPFTIKDKEKNVNSYYVDFVDLNLVSDKDKDEEEGVVYDIAKPEEVTINGKKFDYYIDSSRWNAKLYYQLPDKNGQMVINIRGGNVFSFGGRQLKTLATVDKDVLESKELAEVLNFTVNKID